MWYSAVGLIVALTLGILAAPRAADAQPSVKVARIGYFSVVEDVRSPTTGWDNTVAAFLHGLRDLGYVEGHNLVMECRFAEGKRERLPDLAADLVRRQVDVIVTFGQGATRAAATATTTIPIVMVASEDPVGTSLVASLARPGGNITGTSALATDLSGKRLELLKEAVPPSPGWPCSGMRPVAPCSVALPRCRWRHRR